MKKIFLIICILFTIILSGCGNSRNSLYTDKREILSENNSFNLSNTEQEISQDGYVGKMEFEGMDTIWRYDCATETQLEVTYLLSVFNGTAKLVLITPNGEIETIAEEGYENNDNELTTIKLNLEKGLNRIKLVAKSNAIINIQLKVSQGELYEIGFN